MQGECDVGVFRGVRCGCVFRGNVMWVCVGECDVGVCKGSVMWVCVGGVRCGCRGSVMWVCVGGV